MEFVQLFPVNLKEIFLLVAPVCGGRLFGNSGMIRNPRFSRSYPFGITCIWVVEVGQTSAMDVNLVSSNFNNRDCSKSYLLLRHGMSASGDEIAKYCRPGAAQTVTTLGNTMYVEYRLGEGDSGKDFVLSWKERNRDSSKGLIFAYSLKSARNFINSTIISSTIINKEFI